VQTPERRKKLYKLQRSAVAWRSQSQSAIMVDRNTNQHLSSTPAAQTLIWGLSVNIHPRPPADM
jgi:hypothetical protein